MSEEILKTVGGSFEKRWLINVFGPALVFWGAGLWVWAQLIGLQRALAIWQGYALEAQLFLIATGVLIVYLSAVLLESFSGGLLRFYEGYWPRRPRRTQRRAEDLRNKQEQRRLLRRKKLGDKVTPADRAALARLNAELAHRPRNPADSMPTQLGDILRTAEDYARHWYGLDPITFWPRLYPTLSDPLRQALDGAMGQLNLALRLATLAVLYGTVWSIVVVAHGQWNVLWWTLPALPLAWLLWRSAHGPAASYAGLLRSAFDLHRFDAYKGMHWPRPTSPEMEPEHGRELILYLASGTPIRDVVYTPDDEEDEASTKGQRGKR